ncbi:hypothetical protein FKM82_026803 [Ascaphus truei]
MGKVAGKALRGLCVFQPWPCRAVDGVDSMCASYFHGNQSHDPTAIVRLQCPSSLGVGFSPIKSAGRQHRKQQNWKTKWTIWRVVGHFVSPFCQFCSATQCQVVNKSQVYVTATPLSPVTGHSSVSTRSQGGHSYSTSSA